MLFRAAPTLAVLGLALAVLLARGAHGQDSASDHYLAGSEHLSGGRIGEAAAEFEQAFNILRDDEKIHHALGLVLIEKSADPQYRRLIDLFDDLENPTPSALYWLGRAHRGSGEHEQALAYFERLRSMGEENLKYVTLAEVEEAIGQGPGDAPQPNDGQSWWVNLIVLVVIVCLSVGVVFVLRKWVFVGAAQGAAPGAGHHAQNVVLLVAVALILVFGALGMGWIEGEQFVALFNNTVSSLVSKGG